MGTFQHGGWRRLNHSANGGGDGGGSDGGGGAAVGGKRIGWIGSNVINGY